MKDSVEHFTNLPDQALFFHKAYVGNKVSQTYSGNKYYALMYLLN